MHVRVGIDVRGEPGLVVHRPTGSGDYVFVQFLHDARLGGATSAVARPGDCIWWRPDTPTRITADPAIHNHFVHVSHDLAEAALTRYDVVSDRLVRPASTDFVVPILTRLQAEWARRDTHAERAIELSVEDLLLNLHRETTGRHERPESPHDQRLRDLRLLILRDPAAA